MSHAKLIICSQTEVLLWQRNFYAGNYELCMPRAYLNSQNGIYSSCGTRLCSCANSSTIH